MYDVIVSPLNVTSTPIFDISFSACSLVNSKPLTIPAYFKEHSTVLVGSSGVICSSPLAYLIKTGSTVKGFLQY
jgi:hypothetical protein